MRFGLCLLFLVAACAPRGPDAFARRASLAAFEGVVDRVEPVAETACRAESRGQRCDFAVYVDTDPAQVPNAFQTVDADGQPVIIFTATLLATAENPDELAFVLGHEASHHILGHIPKSVESAALGAAIFGRFATDRGETRAGIRRAEALGAFVGFRRFSKTFELEADALGTIIADRAGYDPRRGAEFFARFPDPGNAFLGTHPPNAARSAVVRSVLARLGRR